MTKQQQIESLKGENERLLLKSEKDDAFKKELEEILGLGGLYTIPRQKILDVAKELQIYRKNNEGLIRLEVDMLLTENRRLWYLVRAFGEDKTLEAEKSKMPTPFDRPNF